jgi:hypothetical protein
MLPSDAIDLRPWIEAAPLERVKAHLREEHAEKARYRETYRASLTPERLAKLDRLNEMLDRFGLEVDDPSIPELGGVVSPVTLAHLEQYRAELGFAARGWPSTPVDVFIWGLGEAPERSFTKIGGLPYRPANLPWPKISSYESPYPVKVGEPMTFLAQFNFAGSKDIFPHLPGDVLLIFAENEEFASPESFKLEWYSLGLPDDALIAKSDMPPPAWMFVTCHGYRYRTVDYRAELPKNFARYHPQRRAAMIQATKIGGIPTMDQMTNAEFDEMCQRSGHCFLAQIRSTCAKFDEFYPWINRREPASIDSHSDDQQLNLVDDGTIYLLLDENGEVDWHFECA